MRFKEFAEAPLLTDIVIEIDQGEGRLLTEVIARGLILEGRKWLKGNFSGKVGVDHPTHSLGQLGQTHAHLYGRNGREYGVVNIDGTSSHGTKCKIQSDQADALRDIGFRISKSNIVEWEIACAAKQVLLENLALGL